MDAIEKREKAEKRLMSIQTLYYEKVEEDRRNREDLERALQKTGPEGDKPPGNARSMNIYGRKGENSYYDEMVESIALECMTNYVPLEFLKEEPDISLNKIANNSYIKALNMVDSKKRGEVQEPNALRDLRPPSKTRPVDRPKSGMSQTDSLENKVIQDIDLIMKQYEAKHGKR
jgi:hypothetical protein